MTHIDFVQPCDKSWHIRFSTNIIVLYKLFMEYIVNDREYKRDNCIEYMSITYVNIP